MASLIDYIIAVREISKTVKEKRRKDALYNVLVGSDLNYMIIHDLVNSAQRGVLINVELRDGTKLEIKQADVVDGVQRPPKDGLF